MGYPAAIKILTGTSDMLVKEATIMLAASTSPNIVRLYGVLEKNGRPYALVMELMPDGSLDKALQKVSLAYNSYDSKVKLSDRCPSNGASAVADV